MAPDECIGTHVCDKLNVPHPQVTQYQQKTIQLLPFSIFIHRVLLKKSPVHLPLFSWHCFKPHRRLFIQIHFSASHVFLDNTVFPFKTLLLEFFQYPYCRVRRFLQPLIHLLLVTRPALLALAPTVCTPDAAVIPRTVLLSVGLCGIFSLTLCSSSL